MSTSADPPVKPAEQYVVDHALDHGGDMLARANWLDARIDEAIRYIGGKRQWFQKAACSIRLMVLLMACAVTILLGLDVSTQSAAVLHPIAFVLGALITTLTSIDFYFNYRVLWVEHEEAKWKLHRLQDRLRFYLAGLGDKPPDAGLITSFHAEYQATWDSLSRNWLAYRRDTMRKE